jgi:hypothetical protein
MGHLVGQTILGRGRPAAIVAIKQPTPSSGNRQRKNVKLFRQSRR